MKVFSISDLHLSINNPKPMDIFGEVWNNYLDEIDAAWAESVGEEDVVLIAGDISWAMTLAGVRPDLDYIAAKKGVKLLLRGNHDYWWQSISGLRAILPPKMYAVQNDCVRVGNLLVCGSRGWTVPEDDFKTAEDKKIYDREILRLEMSLSAMDGQRREGDTVVAMMHFPPFNSRINPTPFTDLMAAHGVDAVVYGHLHGKGTRVVPCCEVGGVPYYLTSCDLVRNKPVFVLEI